VEVCTLSECFTEVTTFKGDNLILPTEYCKGETSGHMIQPVNVTPPQYDAVETSQ